MEALADVFRSCTSVLDGELVLAICKRLQGELSRLTDAQRRFAAEFSERLQVQREDVARAASFVGVIAEVTQKMQRQLRERDRVVQSKLEEEERNEQMYRKKDALELRLAVYGVKPLLEPLRDLFAWTATNAYRIVYDSEEMDFSCAEFQRCVCEKKNIATMVISGDNDVFGAFHSEIPRPKPNDFYWATDSSSFIYTIFSNGRLQPAHWHKKKQSYAVLVRGNDYKGENVYYVYGCIDLYQPLNRETSWAFGCLNNYCVDAPDGVVLVRTEKFRVQRFLALELFYEP